MRLHVLFLMMLAGVCGCLNERTVTRKPLASAQGEGIWRGYLENGDKPGIGIELWFTNNGMIPAYYMMDSNAPGDFTKGHRFSMKTLQEDSKHFIFDVKLPAIGDREIHLRFDGPLKGNIATGKFGRTLSLAIPIKFKRILHARTEKTGHR